MKPMPSIVAFLLLLTACAGCDNNEEAFSDPAFKACVETRLKDYSVFDEKEYKIENEKDLEVIKLLACDSSGIVSVKGAEKLVNVQTLSLNTNQIVSAEPISQLKKLEILQIGDNRIRDVEPLSDATTLRNINISANYIKDFRSLKVLSNLQYLYVTANCATDLSQFDEITDAINGIMIDGINAQTPEKCQ